MTRAMTTTSKPRFDPDAERRGLRRVLYLVAAMAAVLALAGETSVSPLAAVLALGGLAASCQPVR